MICLEEQEDGFTCALSYFTNCYDQPQGISGSITGCRPVSPGFSPGVFLELFGKQCYDNTGFGLTLSYRK